MEWSNALTFWTGTLRRINPELFKNVKKITTILLMLLCASSCRMPESFGFYQPITMNLATPDGPPEYKAGWYGGCKSALSNRGLGHFANAFVYGEGKGPETGSGVYQHDPMYQTGWGQGWFACVLRIQQFVSPERNTRGPLQ